MKYSKDVDKLKSLFEKVNNRKDNVSRDIDREPSSTGDDIIDNFDVDISGADNYISTSDFLEGSVKFSDNQDDLDVDISSADKYIAPKPDFDIIPEEEEKYNDLISLLEGGIQGATLGFGEELGAGVLAATGAEAGYEKFRDYFNPEIAKQRKEAEEALEKIGAEDPTTSISGRYKSMRDLKRRELDEMRAEDPNMVLAGELAGGIATSMATGPAGALSKATGALSKTAGSTKGAIQAAKELTKATALGTTEGAVAGIGYSEGDNLDRVVEDMLQGGKYGALFSLGVPAATKAVKTAGKAGAWVLNNTIGKLPLMDYAKASYSYGRQGKALNEENIIKDMEDNAQELLSRIEKAVKENNTKELRELIDYQGHEGVNIQEAVQETIDQLTSIKSGDSRKLYNEHLLPYLKELSGQTDDVLSDKAEKMAIKKQIESQSKGLEADIKAEKDITKFKEQNNLDVVSTDELTALTDDLDSSLTQEGVISGKQATFEKPEDGSQFNKKFLSDSTQFQPEIKKIKTEDGREVVTVQDLGSGKTTAFVGDLPKIAKELDDLENLTLGRAEEIRKYINNIISIESLAKSDPVEQAGAGLAKKIKAAVEDVIESSGNVELINKNKRISEILDGKTILNILNKHGVSNFVDEAGKVKEISNKLAYNKGAAETSYIQKGLGRLGDEVYTPELAKSYELLKKLNVMLGKEGYENATRAGVLQKTAASAPNLLGLAANNISKLANKGKDLNIVKSITSLPPEVLMAVSTKLRSRNNKVYNHIANQLDAVFKAKDSQKPALMHMLLKQVGVKESIQQAVKEMVDETEIGPEDAMYNLESSENTDEKYAGVDMPSSLFYNTYENEDAEELAELISNEVPLEGQSVDRIPAQETDERLKTLLKNREGYAATLGNKVVQVPQGPEITIPRKTDNRNHFNKKLSTTKSKYGLYYDSEGILSYGIGHKVTPDEDLAKLIELDSQGLLSEEIALEHFNKDVNIAKRNTNTFIRRNGLNNLNEDQILGLQSAIFQQGYAGMSNYPNLIKALKEGNYDDAAWESLDSQWYGQTPYRAMDFANLMKGYDIKLDQNEEGKTLYPNSDPLVLEKNEKLKKTGEEEIPLKNQLPINRKKGPDGKIRQPEIKELRKLHDNLDLPFPELTESIMNDAERILIQKGSGEQRPLSQLENLMEKVSKLRVSDDQKNIINQKAVAMESPKDLDEIKRILDRIKSLS